MTPRERILLALRRERPDRIPWTPCVDGYYLSALAPGTNAIDAVRAFGADVFARHVTTVREDMNPVPEPETEPTTSGSMGIIQAAHREITPKGDIEIITEQRDGEITQTTRTPVGSLRSRWVRNEHAPWIPFPVEHQLKTLEDMKVYRYVVEHTDFVSTYDVFEKTDAGIGDDGVATTTTPGTPFHDLVEGDFGIEQCYYMLQDHPREIEELIEVMHEQRKKACAIVARSPAHVVIGYENTSTRVLSPDMYERYIEGHLNDYADILHASGKVFLTHMCGKLKGFERQLGRSRMDGIVDIAPEPTGDVSLGDAHRMWPDKIVMGGIDATAIQRLDPDGITDYVREILRDLGDGAGVFLGSGDATPRGAPLENLKAVTRTVGREGRY